VFRLRILSEPAVPSESHHAEERFAEDAAAHLAHALATVDEDYRHLLYLVAHLVGSELHLYLEGVALEADLVEVDRREHAAAVALEAGCGVVHLEARNHTHVLRSEVAHKHATDRPVDHVHAAHVARTDSHVVALVVAGAVEAWQVVGVVREVGVHLEDVVVAVLKRPLEACDVGCAEAQLAAALEDEEAVGEFVADEALHDGCGAVGTAVVDYKNVETLLKCEHRAYYLLDVLLLVICRYDYDTVAFVHSLAVEMV